MIAISNDHLDLILQIQDFSTLRDSFLAGGTNLALRYNHRQSIDIDLFIDHQIGQLLMNTGKRFGINLFGFLVLQ